MTPRRPLLVLALALGLGLGGAAAQDTTTEAPADPAAEPTGPSTLPEVNAPPQRFAAATGGRVRVLDKLTGTTQDLDLQPGAAQIAGRIGIVLDDCRYPTENPTSEAYAHLTITAKGVDQPVFSGWMIASSPALSALDHPRYDVWVLGCDLPKD